MPNAGDRLRAVDINLLMEGAELPATTPSSDVWSDWGTALVFPNPGIPVKVRGYGTGQASDNSSTGEGAGMRVGISLDGGLTWDDGLGPFSNVGAGDKTARGAFACQHFLTSAGVPAGDIHVRAQIQRLSPSAAAFFNGTLTAMVIPNA